MSILYYKEMSEGRKKVQEKLEECKFKSSLKKKGLLPVLKYGKVNVYKITVNQKLADVIKKFDENMFDIYIDVILDTQEFRANLCKSSYIPFFKNMLTFRQSTKEDIWTGFHLNDEQSRNDFLKEHAQKKEHRKEEIEEVVERIMCDYVTCIFKRPSKLSKILSYINSTNYIDLDCISKLIYRFLYDKDLDFKQENDSFPTEYWQFSEMVFSNKERNLTEEEKLSVVRDIMDSFDIECVLSEDIDKISDFQLENIFGIKSKRIIVEYSKHNSSILYNSEISNIYQKTTSSRAKTNTKRK